MAASPRVPFVSRGGDEATTDDLSRRDVEPQRLGPAIDRQRAVETGQRGCRQPRLKHGCDGAQERGRIGDADVPGIRWIERSEVGRQRVVDGVLGTEPPADPGHRSLSQPHRPFRARGRPTDG